MAEAAPAAELPFPSARGASLPSRLYDFFRTLARRKPLGFASLLLILAMVIVAAMPSVFARYDPAQSSVAERLQNYCLGPQGTFLCPTTKGSESDNPFLSQPEVEGSFKQPLGTDRLGRDVYSRMVYGTRVAVYVGFGAVLLSSIISLTIGVLSGYFKGWVDAMLQRVVDAVMALPTLVVLLAIVPLIPGGVNFRWLILALGILGGAGGSRVIRSAVLGVRSSQYVDAARSIGATDTRIMVRHIIPNIFGPLMVQATIGLGTIILAEAALSFLGFGVRDPGQPTWGQMLQDANRVSVQHPWGLVWPGLAITLAVFSFNMLGDALRDLLDPRMRGAGGGRFS